MVISGKERLGAQKKPLTLGDGSVKEVGGTPTAEAVVSWMEEGRAGRGGNWSSDPPKTENFASLGPN